MVHLKPLPGSARAQSMDTVLKAAVADAKALQKGGIDAVIVENFGDAPFVKGRVGAHTVASMALAVDAVRRAVHVPVGVNVLRNDGPSAVAIAATTGALFVRVNVLSGVMATDQGIIEGCAAEVAVTRGLLRANVRVLADVFVKHASPIKPRTIDEAAEETAYRGGADGLIVSGSATGKPVDDEDLETVRRVTPDKPLFVGSGVTKETVRELLERCDGVIVGTSLKRGGAVGSPVDPNRVRALVAARL